jgi:hypothetical protein
MYMGALLEQVMSVPANISCTVLESCVSTITCPLVSEPLIL